MQIITCIHFSVSCHVSVCAASSSYASPFLNFSNMSIGSNFNSFSCTSFVEIELNIQLAIIQNVSETAIQSLVLNCMSTLVEKKIKFRTSDPIMNARFASINEFNLQQYILTLVLC